MAYSVASDPVVSPQAQSKPRLSSLDSEQEFSLEHFLEVRRLIALAEREDRELKGYVFDDALIGASV
ncbi:MAG TPA: hypothetical protein VN753_13785 [Terracidiphilus sp.]|jgi:hypothetical protein|nr:hypothetical protein [Terracidiphilus sp.]